MECVLGLTQEGYGSCFVICDGQCGWCKQWKDDKAHEKSEPLLSNHLKRMRLRLSNLNNDGSNLFLNVSYEPI